MYYLVVLAEPLKGLLLLSEDADSASDTCTSAVRKQQTHWLSQDLELSPSPLQQDKLGRGLQGWLVVFPNPCLRV